MEALIGNNMPGIVMGIIRIRWEMTPGRCKPVFPSKDQHIKLYYNGINAENHNLAEYFYAILDRKPLGAK